MDDIYLHGYCNLAATASNNSAGGLFFQRNLHKIRQIQVPCNWQWEETVLSDEYLGNGSCQVMDYGHLQDIIENTPLSNRGWVFQERMLLSRVVHFGLEQVVWECEHRRACETHPDVAPDGPASIIK
jgi:hypothetical protein